MVKKYYCSFSKLDFDSPERYIAIKWRLGYEHKNEGCSITWEGI
jgi:hypothetical protein